MSDQESGTPSGTGGPPRTRREAREQAAARQGAPAPDPLRWLDERRTPEPPQSPQPGLPEQLRPQQRTPRRRRRWLRPLIVTVVILALFAAGGGYAWVSFQPQVQKVMALLHPASTDYTGGGHGTVDITIAKGDLGSDVAATLHADGVVKTSGAFYTLLLHEDPNYDFQPGVWRLKKQMSAKAAFAALQQKKNFLQTMLTVTEGETEAQILPALATATSIPLAQLQQAAATPANFGLPAQATTLEGFLFPATYSFEPGLTAQQALGMLTTRAMQAFTADGVPAANVWNTVILASIVQKEAGPEPGDMGKVARVFDNRIAQGMALQSDATVAYGAHVGTVFTTNAERADASNLYNTYAHKGLPVGPISNPGDEALQAAQNPTPGSWLYFVAVNLQTGETVFSTDYAGQQAAEQQLSQWCSASPANMADCK